MEKITYKYNEIEEYLNDVPKFTKKNNLDTTAAYLKELNDPQKAFKIIHVAGSNGKGSVCSFIQQAFIEAEKSVGCFISPHLVWLEERFLIQGEMCGRDEFIEAFHEVKKIVDKCVNSGKLPHPSYFEMLFLIGMCIFKERKVEYVVLETGLGGRKDTTNVIEGPLVTVITSISLEHTEYLGDTIAKIASEKAGIIKPQVPIIYDAGEPDANAVIAHIAEEKGSPSYAVYEKDYKILEITSKNIAISYDSSYDNIRLTVPFVAEYQLINASLALKALLILEKRGMLDRRAVIAGIENAKWQGRMEQVLDNVFLDGAHNVAGVRSLVRTVKRIANEPPVLLFSMVKEKDYEKSIELLMSEVKWDKVYVTTMDNYRAMPAQELKEIFLDKGIEAICVENSKEAFAEARQVREDGQLLICTGSLYLVGELKKIMEEEK